MELLQNVIESLDQEQVEELLSQFEYELRSKSAKGNRTTYIKCAL